MIIPVTRQFDQRQIVGAFSSKEEQIQFFEPFDPQVEAIALAYTIDKDDPSKVKIREFSLVLRGNTIFEKREG